MDCKQAQDLILESRSGTAPVTDTRDLQDHVAVCQACRSFSETPIMLDLKLQDAFSAPPLSAAFRTSLAKKLRREPLSAWPAHLPDIAHVAGCFGAIALCLWLLPYSAGPVILDGLALTVATWFAQNLLRSSIEIRDNDGC